MCFISFTLPRNVCTSVFQTFSLAGPFWLRKITTDPGILSHVNIEFADDRYTKLNIYISELIPGSYNYIAVAYVTRRCMIWP